MEKSKLRPVIVTDRNGEVVHEGYFHMWTVSLDGWPRGLVELSDGHMEVFGYQRIRFCDQEVIE